jgi:uncharacterized protein (DUF2147 family)
MKSMMMFLVMAVCSLGSLRAAAQADSTQADRILGRWTNEGQTRTIEFIKKDGGYEAFPVVAGSHQPDTKGRAVISGLRYDGKKYTGQAYAPKQNRQFACSVVLQGNDKMVLTGKVGFISQTRTWTRVK